MESVDVGRLSCPGALRRTGLDLTRSKPLHLARLVAFALMGLGGVGLIAGCTGSDPVTVQSQPGSGGSGNNNSSGGGGATPGAVNVGPGLYFAYPAPGQQAIPLGVGVAMVFPGQVSRDAASTSLTLTDAAGNVVPVEILAPQSPGVGFPPDLPPGGIVRLVPDAPLQPDTQYSVKVVKTLGVGGHQLEVGTVLTHFRTRNASGAPAANGFVVVDHSPGGSDGLPYVVFSYAPCTQYAADGGTCLARDTSQTVHFVDTVHLRLSEGVNAGSVVLGQSFKFTDAAGTEIPGRLLVQGHQISFQPTQALAPDTTYTVSLTTAVKSVDGQALTPNAQSGFDLVALDAGHGKGETFREFLSVTPTLASVGGDAAKLPANPLTGSPNNVIDIASSLIGDNAAYAANNATDPDNHRLVAYLGLPGEQFGTITPVVLPAGTELGSTGLDLKLGGKVPAQLQTGKLTITMLTNSNVYFLPNPMRPDGHPTRAIMHLDLALAGTDANGNGVLNQTVLNKVAIGTVFAKDGALVADAVATFPLKIANTGTAIVSLALELKLPPKAGQSLPDQAPPTLLAQAPSACFYAFGSGNGSKVNDAEADCGAGGVSANSFPVDGRPSLVFSKPIDPASLVNASGGHDVDHLQLTDTSGPVAFTAFTQGTSVVLQPDQPLTPNTQYTITAGTGIADLVADAVPGKFPANHLASPQTATFTTAPYVNVAPAAAYIVMLTPGLPCALASGSGDYLTGGDKAGYCAGDAPQSGVHQIFPVFTQPANRPIETYFSKPVKTASLIPANGCLTTAAAGAPVAASGAFALESVDASGACTGVVPAGVVTPNPSATQTLSFDYVPQKPLAPGRYWFVVCGDGSNAAGCSATTQRITDVDGLQVNTDPLDGSGSGSTGNGESGPDVIIPFDRVPASDNYFIVMEARPTSDTNGNGRLDAGERGQSAGHTTVDILGAPFNAYLDGDREIEVQPATSDCSAAPVDEIGSTPANCMPFKLFTSGMFQITSIDIDLQALFQILPLSTVTDLLNTLGVPLSSLPSLASTGRLLMRVQGGTDGSGQTTDFQTGYIVPECTGSINGTAYDYKPCVAVSLNLSVNAPDGNNISVPQQTLTAVLAGPLVFARNGRMVIDLQNTTALSLTASALGVLPVTASIPAGGIHLQLAGYPVHGN